MSELRVGIVGSRRRNSYNDQKMILKLVSMLVSLNPSREVVLVSGGCPKGADNFAAAASRIHRVPIKEWLPIGGPFNSKWEFAKAAFARNEQIAADSSVGFAQVAADRTGGTENTIGHYLNMRKKVILINDSGGLYLPSGEEISYESACKDPDKG